MTKLLTHATGSLLSICVLFVSTFVYGQVADQSGARTEAEATAHPTAPIYSSAKGPAEILSDTGGVDFGPYVNGVVATVRRNWYNLIPEEAMAPMLQRGKVVVDFSVLKNGQIADVRYTAQSGSLALDRAAYGGITTSTPLPALPGEFAGGYLRLRFTFLYNPTPAETESVRISEILVPLPISTSAAPDQEANAARLQAENLLAQIRSGKSFEELAGKNPDVGYFRRGQLARSIEEIVFAMRVGDVSNVVRTNQGFVILKVTDHKGQKNELQNRSAEKTDANAASK